MTILGSEFVYNAKRVICAARGTNFMYLFTVCVKVYKDVTCAVHTNCWALEFKIFVLLVTASNCWCKKTNGLHCTGVVLREYKLISLRKLNVYFVN